MTNKTGSELGPGVELSASVRLVEKLGEGGMGSVWTAQHLTLRTQVAVKFLAAHMAQDAAAAARFQREATAAARIKSPHVVQIFDHGMSADFGPYIVMELLEGSTLSSFVERHGRLTPAYTAQVMTQLCRALGKAHVQGTVHRDIKPDNVFLIDADHEVFVKVLDFGIAKSTHDSLSVTSTGAMMGTPHYMSPEQMLSTKHVDLRADLWASTVLAYHCLTGGVPFDGETFGAVAIAVTKGEFPLPHVQYGVGSPALDAWFARALARDVNARFQTADELADTFAQAAGGWSGRAHQTGSGMAAPGVTLEPIPRHAPPTFSGVANTNGVSTLQGVPRHQSALLVITSFGLGAVLLGGGLLLWKMREPPVSPPIAGTVTTVATLPPSATAALPPPPSAQQLETPPPAPPPAVSAPPKPPVVGTKPKTKPRTPPASPPPTSKGPDRGF
jgi:eukaryotic-like serine/threonine-protein kinase